MAEEATDLDPDLVPRKPKVHALDVVGVLAGVAPFAVPYSTSTSTEMSDHSIATVTRTHMDYSALVGGGVAVVCAVIGLALIGRMGSRPLRLAVFVLLLALGGFQIIRGVLADTGQSSSEGVMF